MKLKRFEDSEAEVLGMEEKMHNGNVAIKNALGYEERSSHQENLIGLNTMGALIVRDLKTNVIFNIGTGFDDDTRLMFWTMAKDWEHDILNNNGIVRHCPIDERIIVKYKYFPSGSKDKPRFPAYLGLRKD